MEAGRPSLTKVEHSGTGRRSRAYVLVAGAARVETARHHLTHISSTAAVRNRATKNPTITATKRRRRLLCSPLLIARPLSPAGSRFAPRCAATPLTSFQQLSPRAPGFGSGRFSAPGASSSQGTSRPTVPAVEHRLEAEQQSARRRVRTLPDVCHGYS